MPDGARSETQGGRKETATTSTPTVLDNTPSCGAPKGWRWGYLPCGCRNDGYGSHINLRTSRLDEADAWAAKNGSREGDRG